MKVKRSGPDAYEDVYSGLPELEFQLKLNRANFALVSKQTSPDKPALSMTQTAAPEDGNLPCACCWWEHVTRVRLI